MHFVDKVFPREERKIFFTVVEGIGLTVAILLVPALLKFVFSSLKRFDLAEMAEPGWSRFIFASLLFLVQVFFFFLHPVCKKIDKMGRCVLGLLLIYLLGCLLSPLLTQSGSVLVFQSTLKLLSVSALLFLLLFLSHRNSPSAILRVATYIALFTATGEAVIGLAQYTLQDRVGISWLGEKILKAETPFALIQLKEGVRWLLAAPISPNSVLRSYGTFDHPNLFGGVLMTGILMTCHLLGECQEKLQEKKRQFKLGLTLALTIQSLALVTTYSRSSWLGVTLGILVFLTIRFIGQKGESLIHKYKLWMRTSKSLLLAIFVAAITTLSLFHHQIIQRCVTSNEDFNYRHLMEAVQLDHGRHQLLDAAQRMIKECPWQGVGFYQFVNKLGEFTDSSNSTFPALPVHNIYMLIAAEVGLPAAVAFILFFILLGWRGLRHPQASLLFALLTTFALVGFFDNYFITSQVGRFLLFVTAGLVLFYPAKKLNAAR